MDEATYKVSVNDTWSFCLKEGEAQSPDWVQTSPGAYHLLRANTAYRVEPVEAGPGPKRYAIRVNGRTYRVTLADDLDQQIERMGFQLHSARSVSRIEAPMPGLILGVHVSAGDAVKEGEPLLILEAMKMENVILSPRDGVVGRVAVHQGEAVEKNSLLLEFET